jgi:hypothetical protein
MAALSVQNAGEGIKEGKLCSWPNSLKLILSFLFLATPPQRISDFGLKSFMD